MSKETTLPYLIAGPILRKATPEHLVFWLVTSAPLHGSFELYQQGQRLLNDSLSQCSSIQIGEHAYVTLAHFRGHFPANQTLSYDFVTPHGGLAELAPYLLYPGETRLHFHLSTQANYVVHGSCRNPHHPSGDALVAMEAKVSAQSPEERPDLLMMAGDQIYADHVAGPTLDAIDQVIDLLGLRGETFEGACVDNDKALRRHTHHLYGREHILPTYHPERRWWHAFFKPSEQPVFSATGAENHLIACAEFIAMYLLVWSPVLWRHVDRERLNKPNTETDLPTIPEQWQTTFEHEANVMEAFVEGLPKVARLLAHVPTYMIFDDHDVTDDWNLTVGWEYQVYQHPFSKRIIGNALIGYWLCQGWGNEPDHFDAEFISLAQRYFEDPVPQNHDAFIAHLLSFEQWHYTIDTSPKVVVLDTRTRRWRSESRMNKPSGLMDWEALMELQQALLHQEKVIIVSPAPMFGVKFIETLQRIVTMLGKPLMVDAENWMAHPGSANTLLSIFTHTQTPTNFVILSGDVHYSFAYDIELRFRKNSPHLYQFTCSGFKSQFPEPLLAICDHADRLLYSPRSPLNWFTKRKRLKVRKRDPDSQGLRRLINASAIGELYLDEKGAPKSIEILTSEGKRITFPPITPSR